MYELLTEAGVERYVRNLHDNLPSARRRRAHEQELTLLRADQRQRAGGVAMVARAGALLPRFRAWAGRAIAATLSPTAQDGGASPDRG